MSSRHSHTIRSLRWSTCSCACHFAELQKSKGPSMRHVSRYSQSCLPTSWRYWSFKVCQTWRLSWVASNARRITVERWYLWQIFQPPQDKSCVRHIAWSFVTVPKSKRCIEVPQRTSRCPPEKPRLSQGKSAKADWNSAVLCAVFSSPCFPSFKCPCSSFE